MRYLQWIFPLLLSVVQSTTYKAQIIAMVGNEDAVKQATKYLFDKNPGVSQVAKWYAADPTDPTKGGEFRLVEWDPTAGAGGKGDFVDKTTIAADKTIKPVKIHDLPHGGRLQVVGHGRLDKATNKITMGGMDPLQLSAALQSLPSDGTAGAVKRVSLVGCSVGELNSAGTAFVGDNFPEVLLEDMKSTVEEVSSRNGIVGVDSSGRKVYGEQTARGTVWRPKEGAITKTIISLDSTGKVQRIGEKIGHDTATYTKPTALSKDFKPTGGSLELEEMGAVGGATPEHVKLGNEDLFKVISSVAKEHFAGVTVDPTWDTKVEKERLVRVLDKGIPKDMKIKIREFSSHAELSHEIKRWGEKGFEFPSYDKTTTLWSKTDSTGAPFADKHVYYRYGDFVYRLKVQSALTFKGPPRGLDPFYTGFEGVIVNEDPNGAASKNTGMDLKQYKFGDAYHQMQPKTDNNFFSDARKWIGGEHSAIGTTKTNAINGETTIAMFTSEAIRDYRAHVTNKLSLDLNAHVQAFDRNVFFKGHPIGRGDAGPAREHGDREGFYESKTGKPKTNFKVKAIRSLVGALLQQWTEAGYKDTARKVQKRPHGSTSAETTDKAKRIKLVGEFKESVKAVMTSDHYMGSEYIGDAKDIAGPLFEGPYDAREVEEPQTESVDSEVNEYHEAEDHSLPLRASHAMLRDQLYVSKEIAKAVEAQEAATGMKCEVNEDSIAVQEGKVTYEVFEPSDPKFRRNIETDLDESKMTSKDLLDEMHEQAQSLQQEGEGAAGKINRGLAIYGAVMGIKGTVEAFERGDIFHGTINLAQTLHGLGELSGINQKIYKAAGKAVGKLASRAVSRVSETIGQVVGEDAGRLIAGEGAELLSTIGEVGELFEDIPIIGTAFGLYNIYEDLQQHTVIGYVDAGLDTLITVLGLLGPEAEPFVIALTIIRLGIDSFYTDIKKELDSLPPDASTGQVVVAVLKGIGEAILDIADTVTGGIYSAPFKAAKLDKQYEENQEFLRGLADYHNYFKVTMCSGNAPAINFAGAADSWNGGDINFQLLEGGRRGYLTMRGTLKNGQERTHSEYINFEVKVNDIIMGIGESNTVNFKKESVKVFWVIPVDEKKIISGLQGDRSTLHGEYHGNSDNNNFFAVQKLPKNLPYGLTDYHYIVKGNGGDDSFYLGPQHTYVEGNAGADTYFLDGDSTHVTLNNYDAQETEDFMIIPKHFSFSFSSYGHDVIITHGSAFKVTIKNWFSGSAYQHLNFKTSDSILFHIERQSNKVVGVPYALSGVGSKQAVWFSTAPPINNGYYWQGYATVKQLIGSDHNDILSGNSNDNVIIPNKGSDIMSGGDGSDTYNIQYAEGEDQIGNGASDEKLDTIIFPANADSISAHRSSSNNDDLIVQSGSYRLKINSWFAGKSGQHVTLYSQDYIFLEIRHDTNTDSINLIPTLKELTSQDANVDLRSNAILEQVTSVAGTEDSNQILGNDLDNYIAGAGGHDVISGKDGADTYVVKASKSSRKKRNVNDSVESPYTEIISSMSSGNTVTASRAYTLIDNYAGDGKTDLLLYDANFDDIQVNVDGMNLKLIATSSADLDVILIGWFIGPKYQHLLVRSKDGIAFTLPLISNSAEDTENSVNGGTLVATTAVMIDKSKTEYPVAINLMEEKFREVKRVIGSPHLDVITGNQMDNYIDPREGGGTMRGNSGSDTYVLKPGYGHINIENIATDNVADTVLFGANFNEIAFSTNAQSVTLRYTDSSDAAKSFSATLVDYVVNPKARHLTIVSSDGITFVISPEDSFHAVPIAINKASQHGASQQDIHLSDNAMYGEVRTVYGFKSEANNITGNDRPNTFVGGDDDDYFQGEYGNDVLKGGAGNNTLIGGPGNDTLSGGNGNDILEGGPDNDILSPGAGENFIDGGDGDDTIVYAGDPVSETGVYVDLNNGICRHPYGFDEIHQVENIYGTPYDDTLVGSALDDNVLNGEEGDDSFIAYDGYDILIGGKGSDTYNLLEASGTKVIANEADDGLLDRVDLSYINTKKLRFERQADSLIIRVVSKFFANSAADQFPGCHDAVPSFINLSPPVSTALFCESYSPRHPTVILQNYFAGTGHRHLTIVTADCSLNEAFLTQQPISVVCH